MATMKFKCDECPKAFGTEWGRKIHKGLMHPVAPSAIRLMATKEVKPKKRKKIRVQATQSEDKPQRLPVGLIARFCPVCNTDMVHVQMGLNVQRGIHGG